MKKQFSTKTKLIIIISVLLAAVLTVSAVVGANTGRGTVQTLLSPFRKAYSSFVRQAEKVYNYMFRYEALEARNKDLEKRNAELEEEIRNVDTLQRENARLRALAALKEEHTEYDLVSAYIVSWDTSNWKSTFTLPQGKSVGIDEGMVVITENWQVIGLVTEAGDSWSVVTTVLDSSLDVSAMITSSGYSGTVVGSYATGEQGQLRMNYLPGDAILLNNDQVVTTGSTYYPRGLLIGYISDADFDETGVAKYAILTPAADFDNLEQVFIVTNYTNE